MKDKHSNNIMIRSDEVYIALACSTSGCGCQTGYCTCGAAKYVRIAENDQLKLNNRGSVFKFGALSSSFEIQAIVGLSTAAAPADAIVQSYEGEVWELV
jgi:hypothetical protein